MADEAVRACVRFAPGSFFKRGDSPVPMPTKELQREHGRQWVAKRRAAWFADKHCVLCGSREEIQIDHLDPAQKVEHRIWSWSKDRREAELAKCRVLCKRCHQERHAVDMRKSPVHGTNAAYKGVSVRGVRQGCRCQLCREAHRVYSRRYRKNGDRGVRSKRVGPREWRRTSAICITCGREFAARVDQIKAGKGKNCSRSCAAARAAINRRSNTEAP